jgi:hypothetical protein
MTPPVRRCDDIPRCGLVAEGAAVTERYWKCRHRQLRARPMRVAASEQHRQTREGWLRNLLLILFSGQFLQFLVGFPLLKRPIQYVQLRGTHVLKSLA